MSGFGYIAVLIAVLFFGSNFVAVKGLDTGDGVFFQFIMCCAIFITSLPVLAIQGFPEFRPLALFGGFLWCTGNMMCAPIIDLIGLGLGLLIWGSVNMLIGWASGRFGLFGLAVGELSNPTLNYAGVSLVVVGFILFLQVKSTLNPSESPSNDNSVTQPLVREDSFNSIDLFRTVQKQGDNSLSLTLAQGKIESGKPRHHSEEDEGEETLDLRSPHRDPHTHGRHPPSSSDPLKPEVNDNSFGAGWSASTKRTVGLCMAAVAGLFLGSGFDPSQWLIDNKYHDSTLNYVFPHFLGIFLTSWGYTMLYFGYFYCLQLRAQWLERTQGGGQDIQKRLLLPSTPASKVPQPFLNPKCLVPATVSGVMWGIACIAFFYANGQLGFSISFPIISSGPGFVAALWGILVFHEIRGRRNLLALGAAFLVTVPGLIMVALSH